MRAVPCSGPSLVELSGLFIAQRAAVEVWHDLGATSDWDGGEVQIDWRDGNVQRLVVDAATEIVSPVGWGVTSGGLEGFASGLLILVNGATHSVTWPPVVWLNTANVGAPPADLGAVAVVTMALDPSLGVIASAAVGVSL